tara:strand:+ start:221 stop:481 length:261 start_codon:yes stop_codon:yes gene_type:complete
LLQEEHLGKSNPRRKELTKEETIKLAKLESIASKLRRGENVQNRQLQTWLSEEAANSGTAINDARAIDVAFSSFFESEIEGINLAN